MAFRDWRTREGRVAYGSEDVRQWDDTAVLAHVLRSERIAQAVLARFTTLAAVAGATSVELAAVPGMGRRRAEQLLAAAEFGRRVRFPPQESDDLRAPSDVYRLVRPMLEGLAHERFLVLLLNTKNRLLKVETVSVGTLNASLVHPREVFRTAIRAAAAAVIVAHNHPTGDPTPSPEDVDLTRRLAEAGHLIGIEVLDHLIVGDGRFLSLREQGVL